MKILVINGPNLNMLDIREKKIYGEKNYNQLVEYIENVAKENTVEIEIYQSNHEGNIVDKIQEAFFENFDGIVINPAAYTHTSVAILDALKSVNIPTIEVHISNINSREDFRKISYISGICQKTISGKGFEGYKEAISSLKNMFKGK